MVHRAHSRVLTLIAASTVLAGLAVLPHAVAAPSASAGPKTMVALGDSYASGPVIPVQYEQPWGCLRSSNNYAHQVARELDLDLTDVTCSGATTNDMDNLQGVSPEEEFHDYGGAFGYTGPGGNPRQLSALRPDTDIVTLQIGGNDIGFLSLAETCAQGAIEGQGCQKAVEDDEPFAKITDTAVKIRTVLEKIHAAAPEANVYVLGYPGIFGIGATASCPAMGKLPESDAEYMRSIQEALNGMIRSVADDPDQTYSAATSYVDVYTPSEGHTACDLPVIRWVEPIVPVNAAAPIHPNLGGMTAIKEILVDRVWPKGIPRRDTLPGLPPPPDSPV